MYRACSCTVFLLLAVGCSEPANIASRELVSDLQVTDRDGSALPSTITAECGEGFEVIVSYVASSSSVESLGGRLLQPHEHWRALWEFRDSSGAAVVADQLNIHELQKFDVVGVGNAREGSSGQGQRIVWTSPDVPKSMDPERDYLWGHVGVPLASGRYRLKISLHPTADRESPHETIVEWGPPVLLFEAELTATASNVIPIVPVEVSLSPRGGPIAAAQ